MSAKTWRAIDAERCIECGTCTSNCPVVINASSGIFPGPKYLLGSLRADNELKFVRDAEYLCSMCMKCGDVCPSKIKVPRAIINIRNSTFEESELRAGHKGLLRNIKTYRRAVEPSGHHPQKFKKADVLYFPGCIGSERLYEVETGTEKLLTHASVKFVTPAEWACCGSPVAKIGAQKIADELMEYNRKVFRKHGAETIITTCPGCASHIDEEYDVEAYHVLEYLYESVGLKKLKFKNREKIKVALHYPCHLYRSIGPYTMEYAEELLAAMPNVKKVEMGDADVCCGGGGGLLSGAPDVARMLRMEKIRNAKDAGADKLLAPCPFCVLNLRMDDGDNPNVDELISFAASRV
jgi:fumarate reductase (CoM/CoB) subunit B